MKEKKGKENYVVIIDAIRQGLQKIFPRVNKNLVDLFESLPYVLANSRSGQINSLKLIPRQQKRYMLFCIC